MFLNLLKFIKEDTIKAINLLASNLIIDIN